MGPRIVNDITILCRYMLAVIDCFSKFLWLFSLPAKEPRLVAECLITVFDRFGFGPPKILQSDNGPEFVGSLVKDLQKRYNMQIINGKPYTPRIQGVVERQNQTVGVMMDKYEQLCWKEGKSFDWSDNLVLASLCRQYNTSYHTAVKMTPFEALFGRKPRRTFLGATFDPENVVEAEVEENGTLHPYSAADEEMDDIAHPSGNRLLLSPGIRDAVALRQRYMVEAKRNIGKNAQRIAKQGSSGTSEVFEVGDTVRAEVIFNVKARRGAKAKYTRRPAIVTKVYKKEDGSRSHIYDVRLLDGDKRVETRVSVSKLKRRIVVPSELDLGF